MKTRLCWITLGIACCQAAIPTQAQAIAKSIRMPPVHGTLLDGQKVDFPDALRGKAGVFVIGFSQGSRNEVASWGQMLESDYQGSNTVTYYAMAELGSVPRWLRGWVTKKIKDSVPEAAQRRFLPVFDHEADWKATTGFSKADDAYVLVVDGSGTVRWRTEGTANTQTFAELKRYVASVH